MPFLIEKQDNEEVKRILAETGIDAGDGYSTSALLWAAIYTNNTLLAWLIDNRADINHQDRDGYTALHCAAERKNELGAKLLLEAGAQIDIADIHGNTPLWTAVFNAKGDMRLVQLYVQAGANLDNLNKYQRTPRQLAETIAGIDLETLR
ncbi:ankyrin repeat domain-containing protein [Hymenobacter sp. KCTC 23674]|uniref:ankyrin repeat domain-containing protein n=1 Tax=unclassified Hymenobacter TaxID=2615202 RepID=UPI001AAC4CF5|nr:ankyrin repeat domain-containing protein [Hymenobacter sp. KCTC 23674]